MEIQNWLVVVCAIPKIWENQPTVSHIGEHEKWQSNHQPAKTSWHFSSVVLKGVGPDFPSGAAMGDDLKHLDAETFIGISQKSVRQDLQKPMVLLTLWIPYFLDVQRLGDIYGK